MSSEDNDFELGNVPPVRINGRGVEVTGQFVHLAGHKKNIFFKGKGNVDRSFTIIAAIAKNDDGLDFGKNGVAIVDNDNLAVLIEGHYQQASAINGPSAKQARALSMLSDFDWSQIVSFITKAPSYHCGVAKDVDMEARFPAEGNFENQMLLGLRSEDQRDYRNEFARKLHAEGLYNLPATSESGMINQLLMRPLIKTKGGYALTWDLSINPDWDLSGHVTGGEDIDPEFDGRWKRELRSDDDLKDEIFHRAFGGYFADGFSVLEMEAAACELELIGGNSDRVVLESFNGKSMTFGSVSEYRNALSEMEPDKLIKLWITAKILDQDFSRKQRHHDYQLGCNTVRAEREIMWSRDIDDELSFR